MARPRFHRIDPARQEALLRAAAKEFAQVGYEGASINRILAAVGQSKGAFYYYFDDKADLAATVLLWAYRDVLALYEQLTLPDDGARFWEVVNRFGRDGIALLQRVPHANELIASLGRAFVNDPELKARVLHDVARPTAVLVTLWKRGQELGAVRSDLPVETLVAVFQGIKEALTRAYLPEGKVLDQEELERLAELQLDMFRRVSEPVKQKEDAR